MSFRRCQLKQQLAHILNTKHIMNNMAENKSSVLFNLNLFYINDTKWSFR